MTCSLAASELAVFRRDTSQHVLKSELYFKTATLGISIAERAAERFVRLGQSAPDSVAASRVSSEQAISVGPTIPFLAILPDCSLVLAALDIDACSDTFPIMPPTTRPRSYATDTSTATSQSAPPSEPVSSSYVVYVPPPQPQYIPPDRPARYPIQAPQLSQSSDAATRTSTSTSGRLRRFGIMRMPSQRRADLEGIPSSLIWSIVSVELHYCPWVRGCSHNIGRSGSSTRLAASSRSFRNLYGTFGLLRGNSSTASRSHPFREDSFTQANGAPSPSHSSHTSMLGWRSPFLHGIHGEMAVSMHEEVGEGAGVDCSAEAVSAGMHGPSGGGGGGRGSSNPAAHCHSMRPGDASTDTLRAALTTPWPSGRGMSLGNAIQLLELPIQSSIPESGSPRGEGSYVPQ